MPGVEADDEWITAPEAARQLGVQFHTVHSLVDRGELPAWVRWAAERRAIKIRRSEVDAYIERCRVKPGTLRHLYR